LVESAQNVAERTPRRFALLEELTEHVAPRRIPTNSIEPNEAALEDNIFADRAPPHFSLQPGILLEAARDEQQGGVICSVVTVMPTSVDS
jgi:hypothetical protein